MGVWIEMQKRIKKAVCSLSLPLWECGLKFVWMNIILKLLQSLPLWECGLKYYLMVIICKPSVVTPLVGVWIEIPDCPLVPLPTASLPLWECGLKFVKFFHSPIVASVTPLVGVWIEIV